MSIKQIVLAVLSWKLYTIILVLLATLWIPLNLRYSGLTIERSHSEPYLVWIWANFDGIHYLNIADRGYDRTQPPFFPLLPAVIRTVSVLTGWHSLWSGLVVAHVAFGLSIWVVWRLLKVDNIKTELFFLVWLLFPTAFFYGAVYNDSLFFLFASLTILLGRKKQWRWAALAAAVATLARLNGLALGVYLGVEYLLSRAETDKQTWELDNVWFSIKEHFTIPKIIKSGILWGLLIPAVFLCYLGYIHWQLGDWSLLFTAMETWNQQNMTFPPQVIWRYIKILFVVPPLLSVFWVALIEFIFWAFYMYLLGWSWKKVRLSYWIFVAVSILIPWLTGSLAGMPRYALHIYPFFVMLTLWFERQNYALKTVYLLTSLGLGFIILGLFTRGYFIT